MDNEKKRQTIDSYNKTAKHHAEKFDKIGARVSDINRAFSYIRKSNPRVVEIGCGNGRDAYEILKLTNDYLGIDLSEELIKIAKKKIPEANFRVENLETFDFPKEVDIIFSFASLLHSDKESLTKVLENASKAMNPQGVFMISLKHGNYHEETIDKENQGFKTYYFYTPEEINKFLPDGINTVFENTQDFKGQKWFTVILQKQ